MSVEPLLLRATPADVQGLRAAPASAADFVEDRWDERGRTWPPSAAPPDPSRMLLLDEYAFWLLGGFADETALGQATTGDDLPPIEGAAHGHGLVRVREPDDVARLAGELAAVPTDALRRIFEARADDFRLAAAGHLADDDAILAFQARCLARLQALHAAAAADGDAVLHLLL